MSSTRGEGQELVMQRANHEKSQIDMMLEDRLPAVSLYLECLGCWLIDLNVQEHNLDARDIGQP